jgi:hypothetical protein
VLFLASDESSYITVSGIHVERGAISILRYAMAGFLSLGAGGDAGCGVGQERAWTAG